MGSNERTIPHRDAKDGIHLHSHFLRISGSDADVGHGLAASGPNADSRHDKSPGHAGRSAWTGCVAAQPLLIRSEPCRREIGVAMARRHKIFAFCSPVLVRLEWRVNLSTGRLWLREKRLHVTT